MRSNTAQKVLENEFPKKVEELTALYNSEMFAPTWSEYNESDYKVTNDALKSHAINTRIADVAKKLKAESRHMLKFIVNVKMWVQMNIPKIEDGNNFGVQVQETMIEEVSQAEDLCVASTFTTNIGMINWIIVLFAVSVAEEIARYYSGRSKISDKRKKYPNVEDYAVTLWEMDVRRLLLHRYN